MWEHPPGLVRRGTPRRRLRRRRRPGEATGTASSIADRAILHPSQLPPLYGSDIPSDFSDIPTVPTGDKRLNTQQAFRENPERGGGYPGPHALIQRSISASSAGTHSAPSWTHSLAV